MVVILLDLITVERDGNWTLHLGAFFGKLSWLTIYAHSKYASYGPGYRTAWSKWFASGWDRCHSFLANLGVHPPKNYHIFHNYITHNDRLVSPPFVVLQIMYSPVCNNPTRRHRVKSDILNVAVTTEVNIALGKPAFMSSTYGKYEASKGNDGNKNSQFTTAGRGSNAWWAVNFGVGRTRVTGVRITNVRNSDYSK